MWTSYRSAVEPETSADDAQERLFAGELGEMQFLPDPRRGIAKAPAGEAGALAGVIDVGGELVFAAQAREAIDEQHAVDVERLVEADQARLVARTLTGLQAEEPRQVDDAVQVPAKIGDAEEPAVAVRHRHHRREREDLARFTQREEEAPRAALDGEPRLRERLRARGLQPFGQPALEIAKGLLVRHSQVSQSVSRKH